MRGRLEWRRGEEGRGVYKEEGAGSGCQEVGSSGREEGGQFHVVEQS